MPAKRISLFNHKGGVSKTTTTLNLGWMLAQLGKRVLLVDTDPQCNLTGLILGFKGEDALEKFYAEDPENNLHAGLAPAFESRPFSISPRECVPVADCPGLYLLPGNIRLSEYETTLGIAQELSGSIQTLQNLPGSISVLLEKTATSLDIDYILVDMSPGLGPINQNLLGTSDYFIVPTAPDFFSVMAIDSLAKVLPRWHKWAVQAAGIDVLRDAAYPFPQARSVFLGTVVQNYRPRKGGPATSFQRWIDEISDAVVKRLLPALKDADMLLDDSLYAHAGLSAARNLALVPDFNSLVALAQDAQKPVYALNADDVGQSGIVLQTTMQSRDQFAALFVDMATRVLQLTS